MALQLDLTDLTSIQTFVHSLRNERLDIILCNAGVMAPPYTLTKHDFELQMATNHHGHFYLMELLTPKLKAQVHSELPPNLSFLDRDRDSTLDSFASLFQLGCQMH
jgi:NAD(P)-dependent dehydrogenase (short-subunit alcohol dehydrogenase family)